MTYLSDRKNSRTKYRLYALFGVLFLILLYMWPMFRTNVYDKMESVIVGYSETKSGILGVPSAIHTYFISHTTLAADNRALELTIERLENELAEKNAALNENDLVKASGATTQAATLVMYPLMKDITTIYSNIVLSKGFKDGVIANKTVYVRGRQPVCTITEVYDTTSLCTLLSAPGQLTDAVTPSSTLLLTLRGNGGGSFIADIPRDTVIDIGTPVYLRSDESMTVGTVVSVARDDQATSWHVYVRGAYNPASSSVFYMIK